MKLLKFIKDLVAEIKEDRKIQQQRAQEHDAWDRAGRPTGPGCDTSWRNDCGS